MRLILLEASWKIVKGQLAAADISGYDVSGLPSGEYAKIAFFDHAWRYLRWNDEWHGNWTGQYPTPEAALENLRHELAAQSA
jgi:hypothetical protein